MTEDEQVVKAAVRGSHDIKTRRIRWISVAVFVAAFLVFLASGWIIYASTKNAAHEGAITAAQVKAACGRGELDGKICAQAEKTEKAVEEAPAVSVVEGPKGDQGEPGRPPTASEVLAAVNSWCSVGSRCKPPGPTQRQINLAVASWCGTGACEGRDATDGTDGRDGIDGQNATAEQISTAVDGYCAAREDKCVGPKGDSGSDGRGITDVSCDGGTGTFTFTYTDGTTEEVPCTPPPEPTPDPVPSS